MGLDSTANISRNFNGVTFDQVFDNAPDPGLAAREANSQGVQNSADIHAKLDIIGKVLGNEMKPNDNGQGNAIQSLPGKIGKALVGAALSVAMAPLGLPMALADGINFVTQKSPQDNQPSSFVEYKKGANGKHIPMDSYEMASLENYKSATGETWGKDGFKVQQPQTARPGLPSRQDMLGMPDINGAAEEGALIKMRKTLSDQLVDNEKLIGSSNGFAMKHGMTGFKDGPAPPQMGGPMPSFG